MTTHHPEQPDEPIDKDLQALLAEDAARARQAPEQLQAKVLALTDPKLLSLLDEALAPEQVPAQLNEKILAATTAAALAGTHDPSPAVIGRITPTAWRYAAAAAILLAAGVGLWWTGEQPGETGDNLVDNNTNAAAAFAQLIESADTEPLFDSATDDVQRAIQNASNRIDAYAIDRDTIWSDMDGYEQFLTELEDAEDTPPAT